ncbi:MAG: hypothetical protein JNJ83_20115 [Verrucomicrobiaceae bacterium]|nr:hypothetical protein [Verrucomicrobiaceae bacterium]
MEEDPDGGKENANERNLGTQPLDGIMLALGTTNHSLVGTSPFPMTHKAVQRARKGRKLTRHMQRRITQALNAWCAANGVEQVYKEDALFNYQG